LRTRFREKITRPTIALQSTSLVRRIKCSGASNIHHRIDGSAGQSFMFHYRVFAACECCFGAPKVSGSFTGFRAVAGSRSCFTRFQAASICCKPKKRSILCPLPALAVPLSIEERILTVQTSPTRKRKRKDDLVHLRSLPTAQPATRMGQVTWAWEEIEAALASGMTTKEVWEAAKLDGLEIPYPQFRVYVSRLRRRRTSSLATRPQTFGSDEAAKEQDPVTTDPFKNLREQREKKQRSGFEYDPFSINKNLID